MPRAAMLGLLLAAASLALGANALYAGPTSGYHKIAAGERFTAALHTDGTVAVFGVNDFGQRRVPASLRGVVDIAAGPSYVLAVDNQGKVCRSGADRGVRLRCASCGCDTR